MFCSFLNLDNDRQQQNWAFLESEKFFNDYIYNIFRGANADLIPKFNYLIAYRTRANKRRGYYSKIIKSSSIMVRLINFCLLLSYAIAQNSVKRFYFWLFCRNGYYPRVSFIDAVTLLFLSFSENEEKSLPTTVWGHSKAT